MYLYGHKLQKCTIMDLWLETAYSLSGYLALRFFSPGVIYLD